MSSTCMSPNLNARSMRCRSLSVMVPSSAALVASRRSSSSVIVGAVSMPRPGICRSANQINAPTTGLRMISTTRIGPASARAVRSAWRTAYVLGIASA